MKFQNLQIMYGSIRLSIESHKKEGFPRIIMEWAGMPEAYINWLGSDRKEEAKIELIAMANGQLEKAMSEDDWFTFYYEFMTSFEKYMPVEQWPENGIRESSSDRAARDERKNNKRDVKAKKSINREDRKKATVVKAFDILELSYIVIKANNTWTIADFQQWQNT